MTTELYTPPNLVRSLKDQEFPQIWLGLQGASGTGKTYSALTFPNPVVVNYDKGLTQWAGKDVNEIPFWDDDFIINIMKCPKSKPSCPQVNRKDALKKFLEGEAKKFTPRQTLIFDSWTAIQDGFDAEQSMYPKITQKGEEDSYDFWNKKLEYSKEIYALMRPLKCNVVITFHEIQARDIKTGATLDKVKPLMSGQFQQQIKIPFSDFYRTVVEEKKNNQGQVTGATYSWQIRSDGNFEAKCRLTQVPEGTIRIEPHFSSFAKYGYKIQP